jgi:hypothetical protein
MRSRLVLVGDAHELGQAERGRLLQELVVEGLVLVGDDPHEEGPEDADQTPAHDLLLGDVVHHLLGEGLRLLRDPELLLDGVVLVGVLGGRGGAAVPLALRVGLGGRLGALVGVRDLLLRDRPVGVRPLQHARELLRVPASERCERRERSSEAGVEES